MQDLATRTTTTEEKTENPVEAIDGPGSAKSGFRMPKAFASANPEVFFELVDKAQERFWDAQVLEKSGDVLIVSHAY